MELSELCVLWDMDGTLVDSYELHYQTWRLAMLEVNVVLERQTFNENFGRTNRMSLPNYLGYEPNESHYEKLTRRKEALFQEKAAEVTNLFPGVEIWLGYLKKQGVKQAIASSAPKKNIDIFMNTFKLSHFFDALVAGSDLPSKPAPDVFLKAAKLLQHIPETAIVIEDAPAGLEAGKKAGMFTIGIATSNPADQLLADLVIPNFNLNPADVFHKILETISKRNI